MDALFNIAKAHPGVSFTLKYSEAIGQFVIVLGGETIVQPILQKINPEVMGSWGWVDNGHGWERDPKLYEELLETALKPAIDIMERKQGNDG